MTEELKPCPFCGNKPKTWWDLESDVHECYNQGYNIECPLGHARIYAIYDVEAIQAWNRRANEPDGN